MFRQLWPRCGAVIDSGGLTTWTRGAAAVARAWPGVALALAVALLAYGVNVLLPAMSPLLVTIAAGALVANLVLLPARLAPGLAVTSKRVLRLGVVLFGLQLSLQEILGLGVSTLAVVVAVVAGGIGGTLLLGRLVRVPATQRLLIACGFAICGAAAVAAVESTVDADEEDVACAIALMVLYGTAMIGVAPLVVNVLGLSGGPAGRLVGGSVHEVAQVVAAGGIVGGSGLGVAIVVKLARVLMLGPVILMITARRRVTAAPVSVRRPPLVPLFVAGFVAAVLVRSVVRLPTAVLTGAGTVQTVLLGAAMFALGTGVRLELLRRVGVRPIVLGVWVAAIATIGVLLTR
jgi:uncharacterized integral membrane protein (TIGR00698 family)